MVSKFLSKYYPYSRALQLRKDILNFWQLPMESVFEAWERFKSCLRKFPDHRIWLIDQIFTFYHGIMMVDQDKIMWDAEVYYDTATGVSAHYSETTSALSAQIEVFRKQTAYTIQSVQHQPRPGHPNTVYYLDSDESDEDEPSEVLDIQKPIHSLSGNPTPSSDFVVESLSPLPTPFRDSDSLLEETDILLSHSDDSLPDYETFYFDIEEKSSGSTTSHFDHSLLDYEAFCFDVDHIEEKSSGSTTSHSDLSLLEYESFHFDLSIDQLPPADRSDFYDKEFADELAHIILHRRVQSQRFHILPLDDFSTISFVSDSLFRTDPSEIETFLSFPPGNKDKVFDPEILIIDGVFSFTRKSPHLLTDMIDKCHILSEISVMTESSVSFLPMNKGIRGESS
ncbi:hypothetical protein Tco_1094739 [Tanacetum coccineum]|uniref:Retrotransposon gag domain-containing protein n=1 Tax=Tanacetum coccineum TaxID=301880 RepID=A0ABQ5IIG6_9ASTR